MKSKNGTRDAPSVSPERVAAFRLSRHHLAKRVPKSALPKVAGDMAGAQAQVLSAAQTSLWARTDGVRLEDVADALWRDRSLAKAWCMRATTHLIPSDEFAVFVRGCRGRAERDEIYWSRAGRPIEAINRIVDAIAKALDRPLTRNEISDRIGDSLGKKKRVRIDRGWGGKGEVTALEVGGQNYTIGGILSLACVRGVACSGPPQGNETTFVRPDAWLPRWRDMPAEDAEDELLRHYLRAHGPATVMDFGRWTYATAARTRETWSRVEDELAPVKVSGRTVWVLREDLGALQRAAIEDRVVRLLPSFDSFLLGQIDKGHLVDAAHYKRVYRPAAWISPVVLVKGRIAGVWTYAREGRRLAIRVEPFGAMSSSIRSQVRDEADDLGRFFDLPETKATFA